MDSYLLPMEDGGPGDTYSTWNAQCAIYEAVTGVLQTDGDLQALLCTKMAALSLVYTSPDVVSRTGDGVMACNGNRLISALHDADTQPPFRAQQIKCLLVNDFLLAIEQCRQQRLPWTEKLLVCGPGEFMAGFGTYELQAWQINCCVLRSQQQDD